MARTFNFPVYQIDFSAVAAGKRVAATKRRIRWRFGFPNRQALEAGRTGTECRGEEHEIVIIWSITSGKRQILMDGREIHYSANRVGILDYSWNTKGNHVLKTVCHASPPISATPGFRQYDLFIDGQSFFTMPKLYELGVRGVSASDNRVPGDYSYAEAPGYNRSAYPGAGYGGGPPSANIRAPLTHEEEDAELQKAIQASLEESKQHLGESKSTSAAHAPDIMAGETPSATGGTADLLDFDGPSSSQSVVPALMPTASVSSFTSAPPPGGMDSYAAPPPPQPQQNFAALPPSQPGYGGASAYQQPPATPQSQTQYGAPPAPQQQFPALPSSQPFYGSPPVASAPTPAPTPSQDSYAMPQSYGGSPPPAGPPGGGYGYDDPFAPRPPTQNDITNDILKAYGGTTPSSNAGGTYASTPQSQPGRYQPGQPFSFGGTPESQHQSAPPQEDSNGGPKLSMNGLALTSGEEAPLNPFEQAMKKLVNIDHIDEPAEEQIKLSMKKQEDERAKKMKNRSVPLPPAASRIVGSGATLGEISKVKPPTQRESVMKPPSGLFQGDAAAAGALVVHGQGPPPLQPRGFGVVHMQGQYPQAHYGQQQRYNYR